MPDPKPEPNYFNDKNYNELKRMFGKYKNIKYDDDFTNDFITSRKQKNTNLPFPDITIRYLREHLLNGHVPFYYGIDDICKYINYWLNREIRQPNNFKYGTNFDLFKEFALELSQNKRGNENIACKNILNYMDSDIYEKLSTIYELYELYNKLKSKDLHVDKRCEAFGYIIANYNKAIEMYDNKDGEDSKLIEKLLVLKKLTVESDLPPDDKCPHRKRQFKEPNKYIKRLEEIETKKREELQKKKEQEELQRQKEQKAKEDLERQKVQKLLQEEKHGTNELLSNGDNVLSAAITQQNERGQSFGAEYPGVEGYLVRQGFSRPSFFSEQHEQIEERHPEFKDKNMDTSTTSGITGAIKDTFTTIVQNVDPAPVLGVSGGMGVLFVLFKYTPFGSFFGGRRGRFRQIPSSFRGFPPDFANLQEYGGGYVGYGPMYINPLAE
ncbi:VIR protein [Plasmodium vivax]|uniref:VIR protein n=1 Tax=Plasmodium vivax TaxID=5855 RepID=A0A1G4E918_PLAVI|nr:VIR protein [Plasmodium vivax]